MLSAKYINELLQLHDDAFVDTREAAAFVGLEYHTLNWYRQHALERSPKFHRVGSRAIRYRVGDLRAYMASGGSGSHA
jgi:predicted DNA-binding transcriptional regulator AlpA